MNIKQKTKVPLKKVFRPIKKEKVNVLHSVPTELTCTFIKRLTPSLVKKYWKRANVTCDDLVEQYKEISAKLGGNLLKLDINSLGCSYESYNAQVFNCVK